MNILERCKKYKWPVLIFLLFTIPLLFLLKENSTRGLIVLLSLLLWLAFSIKSKDMILSSILYIFFTLPFNITYQISHGVLFLGTNFYVDGIYTNYLVPTLSILDIGFILVILSTLFTYDFKKAKRVFSGYWKYLVVFLVFLLIEILLKKNLLVFVNSMRLFAFLLTVILLVDHLKRQKGSNIFKYIVFVSLFNVLLQGVIGILQFMHGSSLGLGFLGESQVIDGMQGSSFVTLNNEVFLRAYGTFPHPNILGGYLVLNLLLGIFISFKSKGLLRSVSILLSSVSFLFVFFTFSRIAIFLSVLIILVTFVSHLLKKHRIYSFVPILIVERFGNLLTSDDTSLRDRINLAKSSFQVIKNNLIMGTGLGNFTSAMKDIPTTVSGVLLIQPVHNVLLLMISEMGILGTLIYLSIWVKLIIKNIGKMNIFKWLIVIVLLVMGSFDHYLFSLPQGLCIGGLLMCLLLL
jgi:O-antigen ligase